MNNAVCAFHRMNVFSGDPVPETTDPTSATTNLVTRSGLNVKAAGRRSETKLHRPSGESIAVLSIMQ